MYRIYWTLPDNSIMYHDMQKLTSALALCNDLRKVGYKYVTMVSDYADMVGEAGAKMAGTEYVPQLLN